MPYLETAQSWLTQSTLLLQARPSTTRITTKYTIKPPPDPNAPVKPRKPKSKPASSKPTASDQSATTEPTPSTSQTTQTTHTPEPIRATLTLKTYDPVSGTTLKYSTTKAAEVSRLIQILGRQARPMAGLPEVKEDIAMVDAGTGVGGEGSGVATPVLEAAKPVQQGGGGGGKKKGKKGKK